MNLVRRLTERCERFKLIIISNPNNIGMDGVVCTPDLNTYTSLDDSINTWPSFSKLGMNENQWAYAERLADIAITARLFYVMFQGYNVLDAAGYTNNNQPQAISLPPNQWQIEVNSWFAATLSYLQRTQITEFNQPSKILAEYWRNLPPNATGRLPTFGPRGSCGRATNNPKKWRVNNRGCRCRFGFGAYGGR